MKKFLIGFLVFALVLFIFPAVVSADVNAVTPSTNDINRTKSWAHVNVIDDTVPGEITLRFVSTRAFASCFEYRTDGDITQKTSDVNYNTFIKDGLYPYVKVNNSTSERTFQANEYIEVRMVFGAETDERFDWTRFDVLPIPDTTAPDVEVTAPTTYLVSGIVEIKGSIVDDNPHHYWLVVVNSEGSKVDGPGTVNETNSLVDASLWIWDTTLVPDGIYTIKLEARDVAGNKDSGSVDWLVVEVDNVTTKAGVLIDSGVPGKGLENAPGLQKPFNPNSQAGEKSGQK